MARNPRCGSAPISPWDGLSLVDQPASSGSPGNFVHSGLANGTTYAYSVFLVDASGNASSPATVQSTPFSDPPGNVQNLTRTDVK